MSEKLSENNFTKDYEGMTQSSYGEFEKKQERSFKNWGVAEYEGEYIDFYTNPEYIRDYFTAPIIEYLEQKGINPEESEEPINIVDFGGGDGILTGELKKQFEEKGYKNISFVNLDYNFDNLKKTEQEVSKVQGDMKQLPIQDESVDIAVSRHTLQYSGVNEQPDMLKNIYNTLKSDSLFVMQWPGAANPEEAPVLTEFYNEITAIIMDTSIEEVSKNKYFTSFQEAKKMSEEAGFTVEDSGQCEAQLGGITVEGFSDRFKVTEEKKQKIQEVFERYYDQYKDDPETLNIMKDEEGDIINIMHHNYIILKK